jgi:hypothetical protein
MCFPSQPVTSMRLIGFEDNFFACPAEGERLKKKLSYKEMRELETMEERIAEKRSKEVMK